MDIYHVSRITPGSRDTMNKTDLKVIMGKQDHDT